MPSEKGKNKELKVVAEGYALRLNAIQLDVGEKVVTMVDADDLRALMFSESLKERSKLHDPKFFKTYYEENKDFLYYVTSMEKKMFLSLEVAREYAQLVRNEFLQKFLDKAIERERVY
eukprot:jgi/Galph1/3602/GphlegSOOS_G2246.1